MGALVIAGIDYSTKAIDIVLVDEEDVDAPPRWIRSDLSCFEGDSFDRSRRVRDVMPTRGWWQDEGIVAVGIEDPRGYAAGHAYRVQGGILQCIPWSLLVQPWIPSEWRAAVGLKGNAPKSEVMAHVMRVLPGVASLFPQDACDAYCIAIATRNVVEIERAA